MSTKIFHGIKFKSQSLSEITKQLLDIKPEAIRVGNETVNKEDFQRAFLIALHNDKGRVLSAESFKRDNDWYCYELEQDIIERLDAKNRRNLEPRFLFSVMIFPHPDGTFYGYYIDDNNPAYREMLFDNDIAEEFYYQSMSDKPKKFTDAEWDNRRQVWDDILGWDTLDDRGWEFKIVKPEDFILDTKEAIIRLTDLLRPPKPEPPVSEENYTEYQKAVRDLLMKMPDVDTVEIRRGERWFVNGEMVKGILARDSRNGGDHEYDANTIASLHLR